MADGPSAEFMARTDPRSRRMQQWILAAQGDEEELVKGTPADEHRRASKQPTKDPRVGSSIVSIDLGRVPESPGSHED